MEFWPLCFCRMGREAVHTLATFLRLFSLNLSTICSYLLLSGCCLICTGFPKSTEVTRERKLGTATTGGTMLLQTVANMPTIGISAQVPTALLMGDQGGNSGLLLLSTSNLMGFPSS